MYKPRAVIAGIEKSIIPIKYNNYVIYFHAYIVFAL